MKTEPKGIVTRVYGVDKVSLKPMNVMLDGTAARDIVFYLIDGSKYEITLFGADKASLQVVLESY